MEVPNRGQLHHEARALYHIAEALTAGLDMQALMNTLLAHTVEELGYQAATLRLLASDGRGLILRASYGLHSSCLTREAADVSRSDVDQHVLSGCIVTATDVRTAPGFQDADADGQEGLVSAIALPLTLCERMLGVLEIYTADSHNIDDGERALLSAVANLAAASIQRVHYAAALREIGASLTASLELKPMLGSLLLRTAQALGTQAGSLRLLGPRRQTLHLAAAYGLSDSYLAKRAVKVAESGVDRHVLIKREPLVLTELSEATELQYPVEAQREGIRAVLVAPLCARGDSIGVLRVYASELRHFGSDEVSFAATAANLGALALENAKLHEALKQRLEALQADSNAWQRFLTMS